MSVNAAATIIELQDVYKHFGEGTARVDALRGVTLAVAAGQVVGLRGPSGSGKTTVLNIIGCILEPSSGRVRLEGELIHDGKWLRKDLRRLRLEKIGFIFQQHNLLPFLTSTENVSLVLDLAGFSQDDARRRAHDLLDYLEVGHRRDAFPAQLSGGEAQRIAIARALANHPKIILADEPTAALDSQRAQVVMDLLRRVAVEQEAAIVTVTHDEKIFSRLDRVFHLRDGLLVD
jgi:putative ABC transport system ATP-binding protein